MAAAPATSASNAKNGKNESSNTLSDPAATQSLRQNAESESERRVAVLADCGRSAQIGQSGLKLLGVIIGS